MRTLPVTNSTVNFNNSFRAEENAPKITNPDILEPNKKPAEKNKSGQIVTSAIALAALVASGVAIARRPKAVAEDSKVILDGLKEQVAALEEQLKDKSASKDLINKYNKLLEDFNNIKNADAAKVSEKVASLKGIVDDLGKKISDILGYPTKTVEINGQSFPLIADVMNRVEGETKEIMEKTLQKEAAKRIFGVGAGLKNVPEQGMIRIPTSEVDPFSSTGGMSKVPKEIADNLATILAGRQGLQVVIDTPLYLGRYEKNVVKKKNTFLSLEHDMATNSYSYLRKIFEYGDVTPSKVEQLAKLELIDTMQLPIHTENGIVNETVRLFKSESRLALSYEELKKSMSETTLKKVEDTLLAGKAYETKGLVIKKGEDGSIDAYAKIQNILYDNHKFYLDTPAETYSVLENGEKVVDPINIYTNKAYSAGETERFVYFDKFFYEHLFRGKDLKEPLSAELILGNDWQTGGISAMIRQLTTVRKNYGLAPDVAEKIQNTPIITILHNAGLSGGVWHSQPKLLNLMFGEHAATIAENSWMPNVFHQVAKNNVTITHNGLPGHLQNALMEGNGVNPQMMAAAYSDFLVPVSKGYASEIANMHCFGGARKEIFELRARTGEFYRELDNIKILAKLNGIDKKLIKDSSTLVGIPNGVDKVNNTLTPEKIKYVTEALDMPLDSFKPYTAGEDVLAWHNKNKMSAINKVIEDIKTVHASIAAGDAEVVNPMAIELPLMTDLSGVTEKTPIFVSAGRIVDQKGLDIFAEAIKEYYNTYYKGGEIPVFYVQGIGGEEYKNMILKVKKDLYKTNPDAAKRIVFANLFSEAGRYDLAKLFSDFSVMSSWFEPCGLVHKQIGLFSGAIPVVNKTGGLAEELKPGVNIITSEFMPKQGAKATEDELSKNGERFAKAIDEAVRTYADQEKYGAMVKEMMNANFDWILDGGSMDKYLDLMARLKVVKPNIRKSNI